MCTGGALRCENIILKVWRTGVGMPNPFVNPVGAGSWSGWNWGLGSVLLPEARIHDGRIGLVRVGGGQVSTSVVGRILSHLKANGLLEKAPDPGIRGGRRPKATLHGAQTREPAGSAPGDIVQIGSPDLRPLRGVDPKDFTVRDVVFR